MNTSLHLECTSLLTEQERILTCKVPVNGTLTSLSEPQGTPAPPRLAQLAPAGSLASPSHPPPQMPRPPLHCSSACCPHCRPVSPPAWVAARACQVSCTNWAGSCCEHPRSSARAGRSIGSGRSFRCWWMVRSRPMRRRHLGCCSDGWTRSIGWRPLTGRHSLGSAHSSWRPFRSLSTERNQFPVCLPFPLGLTSEPGSGSHLPGPRSPPENSVAEAERAPRSIAAAKPQTPSAL